MENMKQESETIFLVEEEKTKMEYLKKKPSKKMKYLKGYVVVVTVIAVVLLAILVYRETYRPMPQQQQKQIAYNGGDDVRNEESSKPFLQKAALMMMNRPQQRAPKSLNLNFYDHQKKQYFKRRHIRATAKHRAALRTTCKTNIPACMLQRKDLWEFSKEFDLELYYNELMRTIITLFCHFAGKPMSCSIKKMVNEGGMLIENPILPLKENTKDTDIKILHDYSDIIDQFVQSLTTMSQHTKVKSKSALFTSEMFGNFDKIIQKFISFQSKMTKIKMDLMKCSTCSLQLKDPPKIQQFNSTNLKTSMRMIQNEKYVNIPEDVLQARNVVYHLYNFVQQMSLVLRRQENCFE